jgi:transposase
LPKITARLIEIFRNIDENAHAVLMMDQAGWHMSNNLVVPENITILPPPPKSPELNPVENIWQFMRTTGSQTACSGPTRIC